MNRTASTTPPAAKPASAWTRDFVEARLVEAQNVITATVRMPDPRGRSADIPAPVRYFGEEEILEFERLRHAYFEQEGYFDDKGMLRKAIPWIWPLEAAQPQAAVDRAVEAMSWPVRFIPGTKERVCVLAWMIHRARRGRKHGYTELVNARLKLLYVEPVEKWFAHRLKGQGLDRIAKGLNAENRPIVVADVTL